MRPAALVLCAALLAAGAASAAPSGIEPALGNVIVSTHPDGRQAKLWLKRDGTYAAQGRKGQRSSGVWKVKGKKLCLTQKKPSAIPLSYCKTFPQVRLGSSWRDKAVTGEMVVNRLQRG